MACESENDMKSRASIAGGKITFIYEKRYIRAYAYFWKYKRMSENVLQKLRAICNRLKIIQQRIYHHNTMICSVKSRLPQKVLCGYQPMKVNWMSHFQICNHWKFP